jgi:hypothetical protein
VTTTDVTRHMRRPEVGGLDDRSERLLKDVKKRADATREDVVKRADATREDVVKRTEATREQLASLVGDVGEELGERAAATREALVERYHEIEEDLPTEEIAIKAQLGAWRALRAGLTPLLALPALAVRGLRGLSEVADDLAERGAEVSERSRELIAAVPPSKAERRRSRAKLAGVAGLGFLAGLITGWVLAGRRQTVVTYEPPLPANWEPVADPAHSEGPGSHVATSQADVLDVRSETDRDPGRGA